MSAYDLQKDANQNRDKRQKILNRQFLLAQNKARKDGEMLSKREFESVGDLSINHGLIESNLYVGNVVHEDHSRVKSLKNFLMEQTAKKRLVVNFEKEKDKAVQLDTVKKGLAELEEEKKQREERRKMTQELNREVWTKQIELKRRHNQISGSVGRSRQ